MTITAMLAVVLAAITQAAVSTNVTLGPDGNLDPHQTKCLTDVIYQEARGEPARGQRYVADVVLNRVAKSKQPTTICKVAAARGQFAGYRHRAQVHEPQAYARAAALAVQAQQSRPVTLAMFFYDPAGGRPTWARGKPSVQVGRHVFVMSDLPIR